MQYILALHIIFVVCWFAGLFYIVRLFIYATEANLKPEPERSILLNQFHIMKKRLLYGITWPAGILTIFFGAWRMFYNPYHDPFHYLFEAWFILKLIFVGFLVIYHIQCQVIFSQQSHGLFKFSSLKLRLFNEVVTIVLFVVIFLVELQQNTSWIYTILGIILLIGLILFATFLYRNQRVKKEKESEKEIPPSQNETGLPPAP